MLDRKIFFLILAILASYVLFTVDGFTALAKFTGSLSSEKTQREKDNEDAVKNPDKWESGGEPLNENQGLGIMQAKFKNEIKEMIKEEVTNNKGVKI